MVRLGLTTTNGIEQRATSALSGYIGGQEMLCLNIHDAVTLARQVGKKTISQRRTNPATVPLRESDTSPIETSLESEGR